MSHLFAALDAHGQIRFVGDVPRGAGCGCFCPACLSPLVAKQGERNEWHFAHEAGQERPECLVGALNLLRNLAIEHLSDRPPTTLPAFRTLLRRSSPIRDHRQDVSWTVDLTQGWQWTAGAPRGAPVGSAGIDAGIPVDLYVESADGMQAIDIQDPPDRAILVFVFAPPQDFTQLRHRDQALRFIEANSNLRWVQMPDLHGQIQKAQEELHDLVRQDEEELQRLQLEHQREAGRRWAGIHARLNQRQDVRPSQQATLSREAEGRARAAEPIKTHPWAPEYKPNTQFKFFRLRDGSAWVLYSLINGGHGIAPWGTPDEVDGWDESLPPSVGTVDASAGIYRTGEAMSAILFFNQQVAVLRTSRDPSEFTGL